MHLFIFINIQINLIFKGGGRYSVIRTYSYISSNIMRFINILEPCKHNYIKHLIYANSSSV